MLVMASAWILFRNVVVCDVKRRSRPGFCERRVKGALFGCKDHYWEKVAAWSRCFGAGYPARKMHVSLPILRWQAETHSAPQSRRETSTSGMAMGADPAGAGNSATGDAPREAKDFTPSIPMQATSFYITILSGAATIAGLALSIAQAVK
jgi:hypothetical protein